MNPNIRNPERFTQCNHRANLPENINQPLKSTKPISSNTCKTDKDTKLKNVINSCKNVYYESLQDSLNTDYNNESENTKKALLTDEIMMSSKDNERAISEQKKHHILQIVDNIGKLEPHEKLYLYLRLPSVATDSDPLKQSRNPLGSRNEIGYTINWIKSHLERDPNVSIPKQDVYNDYLTYCSKSSIKSLSTADFGKVMKQVFPGLRPRRLGTRGNSRYCYAAIRKTKELMPPRLQNTFVDNDFDEILDKSSWHVIKNWAERLLNVTLENPKELIDLLIANQNQPKECRQSKLLLNKRKNANQEKRTENASDLKIRKRNKSKNISTDIKINGVKDVQNETDTTIAEKMIANIKQEEQDDNFKLKINDNNIMFKKYMINNYTNNTDTINDSSTTTMDNNLMKLKEEENEDDVENDDINLIKKNKIMQIQQQQDSTNEQQLNSNLPYNEIIDIASEIQIPRERVISVCYLDKHELDSYLIVDDNSQDQQTDTELLQCLETNKDITNTSEPLICNVSCNDNSTNNSIIATGCDVTSIDEGNVINNLSSSNIISHTNNVNNRITTNNMQNSSIGNTLPDETLIPDTFEYDYNKIDQSNQSTTTATIKSTKTTATKTKIKMPSIKKNTNTETNKKIDTNKLNYNEKIKQNKKRKTQNNSLIKVSDFNKLAQSYNFVPISSVSPNNNNNNTNNDRKTNQFMYPINNQINSNGTNRNMKIEISASAPNSPISILNNNYKYMNNNELIQNFNSHKIINENNYINVTNNLTSQQQHEEDGLEIQQQQRQLQIQQQRSQSVPIDFYNLPNNIIYSRNYSHSNSQTQPIIYSDLNYNNNNFVNSISTTNNSELPANIDESSNCAFELSEIHNQNNNNNQFNTHTSRSVPGTPLSYTNSVWDYGNPYINNSNSINSNNNNKNNNKNNNNNNNNNIDNNDNNNNNIDNNNNTNNNINNYINHNYNINSVTDTSKSVPTTPVSTTDDCFDFRHTYLLNSNANRFNINSFNNNNNKNNNNDNDNDNDNNNNNKNKNNNNNNNNINKNKSNSIHNTVNNNSKTNMKRLL